MRSTHSRRRKKNRRPPLKVAQPINREVFEATVRSLSHDCRGLGQWQGKTLFVDGGLPNERLKVELMDVRSKFAQGRMLEVIDSSDYRVEPECHFYHRCGGCRLQHLDAKRQVVEKETIVLDQLKRFGGVEPRQILPPLTGRDHGYRNRARLAVDLRKGQWTLGFREQSGAQVVALEDCLVLEPALARLITPLTNWLNHSVSKAIIGHIELYHVDSGSVMVLRHTRPLPEHILSGLERFACEHQLNIWLQGEKHQSPAPLIDASKPQNPQDAMASLPYYQLASGLRLYFTPGDFIQVNSYINQQMISQALNLLALTPDETMLDLFSGVGNFSLPLAQYAGRVVGVEGSELMVASANSNAEINNIANAYFYQADLTQGLVAQPWLKKAKGSFDAVLLDPPRAGAEAIAETIHRSKAKRILYISCNPSTLARDSRLLVAKGFELDTFGIIDMFPHTHHVESMALFRAK